MIWLDIDDAKRPKRLVHTFNGRAMLVDFIGRRTLYPGSYGHLSLFRHGIIVDRVIAARELR